MEEQTQSPQRDACFDTVSCSGLTDVSILHVVAPGNDVDPNSGSRCHLLQTTTSRHLHRFPAPAAGYGSGEEFYTASFKAVFFFFSRVETKITNTGTPVCSPTV